MNDYTAKWISRAGEIERREALIRVTDTMLRRTMVF